MFLSAAGRDMQAIADEVAAELETAAGVRGSTILPSVGRWRGKSEPGAVLELAYQPSPDRDVTMVAALKSLRRRLGLAFYVTRSAATAAGIY